MLEIILVILQAYNSERQNLNNSINETDIQQTISVDILPFFTDSHTRLGRHGYAQAAC